MKNHLSKTTKRELYRVGVYVQRKSTLRIIIFNYKYEFNATGFGSNQRSSTNGKENSVICSKHGNNDTNTVYVLHRRKRRPYRWESNNYLHRSTFCFIVYKETAEKSLVQI